MLTEVFQIREDGRGSGSPKIDKILNSIGSQITDEGEWLDLALACLDQAGVKSGLQRQVLNLVQGSVRPSMG